MYVRDGSQVIAGSALPTSQMRAAVWLQMPESKEALTIINASSSAPLTALYMESIHDSAEWHISFMTGVLMMSW